MFPPDAGPHQLNYLAAEHLLLADYVGQLGAELHNGVETSSENDGNLVY